MDVQAVLAEVDSWPIEDQLRLMGQIWDRLIDQGYEPELPEELKAELDRRLDVPDENPGAAVPWEEVEARAISSMK